MTHRTPVLLGLGYDASASFLRGAALAPPAIRKSLYSPASNGWSESGIDVLEALTDNGDLDLPGTPEAREMIEHAVDEIVARGERPVLLGGDHSVTYGIVRGLTRHVRDVTVVQIDAHPDLYDVFDGDRFSHACQFARIMEEGLVRRLCQVGIRTFTGHQRDQATRFGVEVVDMPRWSRGDRLMVSGPIYLSIDLDGIDPAFAPGVSHPEPGGLTVREVLELIRGLGGPVIGADIVELNPHCDVNDRTAGVAAKLVKEVTARIMET